MSLESEGSRPPDLGRPVWWYAKAGEQFGPIHRHDLVALRERGVISPSTLVWREGEETWVEYARAGVEVPSSPGRAPQAAPPEWRHVDIATVILLSVVTCGVWGLVEFYRVGVTYERAAGRRSNFNALFWSYVGFSIATLVLPILIVAVIPLGAFLLKEVLDLRGEFLATRGLDPGLTTASNHLLLWTIGSILSLILVGLILLIIQAVKFFEDHDRIVELAT